jgi:hypothetical protein
MRQYTTPAAPTPTVAPLPADGVEWGARPSGEVNSSPAAEQNACHGGGDA